MKQLLYLIPILCSALGFSQSHLGSQWQKINFEHHTLAYDNPMFLAIMDSINLGHTTLGYFHKNNYFRDAYMPKRERGFKVQSERFVSVKDWKVYGNFSFSKYEELEARYSAMANPYRDTPYQVVDSVQADWRKQHYLLEVKAVSPQINAYTKAGIGIKYEVLNGARQRDPRPLDKSVTISLSPSLIFEPHRSWKLGVNGYYARYRQDLAVTLENNLRSKKIYKMLGLGEYLYNGPILLTGSLSRMYEGNTFGGGLTMGYYLNPKHQFKAMVSYKTHVENATDGSTPPYNAGKFEYDDTEARVSWSRTDAILPFHVSLYALNRTTSGTEYIQVLNNTTQLYDVLYASKMHSKTLNNLGLTFEGMRLDDKSNLIWQYQLQTMLQQTEERYPSTGSKQESTNWLSDWALLRWFNLKKGQLSAGYQGQFQYNLERKFVYFDKAISSNFIAHQMAYPNHVYHTAPYLNSNVHVQYIFPEFQRFSSQVYLKAAFEHLALLETTKFHTKGDNNTGLFLTLGLYN